MLSMIELGPTWRLRRWLGLVFVLPVLAPLALFGPRSGGAIFLSVLLVAGYVALCVALGRRKITLDDAGLALHGLLGVRRVPWRELAYYSYATGVRKLTFWDDSDFSDWLIDIFVRLVTRRFRVRVVLHLHSGDPFVIDGDFFHLEPALDELMTRVHAVLGDRADRFEGLTLEDSALCCPRGRLRLLDIEEISLDRSLHITTVEGVPWEGAWYSVPLHELRNGAHFIQRLAERTLPIKVDASVTLPAAVRQAIADARARQLAMPRAEVVGD